MKRLLNIADDKRTPLRNYMLGAICASIAGAINAGGFLIVGQYTSHVTGIIANVADAAAFQSTAIIMNGIFCVGTFMIGAIISTLLIQAAEQIKLHSRYALALLGTGVLLIGLGAAIKLSVIDPEKWVLKLGLFCSMGMQNATVSRLSNYEIRATHMTGVVTDIGIEIGKWFSKASTLNIPKLSWLIVILSMFLAGGIAGAIEFKTNTVTPLWICGGILSALALLPIYRDTHIRFRYLKQQKHNRKQSST